MAIETDDDNDDKTETLTSLSRTRALLHPIPHREGMNWERL